jgi:arabinofuranosyltransferase
MSKTSRTDRIFTLIVLVYCAYAVLFIIKTSFVVGGTRYFSLFDDAMISMRYAKNFAAGRGLVWNPGGERVEGFTNPLWTLYMSALHLLPVATTKVSVLVQASAALFLLANIFAVRKLSKFVSDSSGFVVLTAALLTAFYLPLNNWGIQGMEVCVLALILTLAALSAAKCVRAGKFSAVPFVLLGLSIFIRTDMAVPFVGMLLFLAVSVRSRRTKFLVWGFAFLAACILVQTAFRMWYYGDALPNSYYVKLTGYPALLRWSRGLYVTLVFLWRSNWLFFALPLAVILVLRDRVLGLLGSVLGFQLLYSIYVGGDAWESWGGANRYVCIAMPVFFVLLAASLAEAGLVIRRAAAGLSPETGEPLIKRHGRKAAGIVVLLVLLSFNAIYGPSALTEWLLLKPPLHVEDNARMVERALALRKFTSHAASIAVVWDGAIPYFADRYSVSILGKNDRHIARIPMRKVPGPAGLVAFYPGHLKWDYSYSLGELKPDVVVQLWKQPEEAEPHLTGYVSVRLYGYVFHIRENSQSVRWDLVRSMVLPE